MKALSKSLPGKALPRPTEQTPSAIEKTIERINKAGITDIFLEAYFHGKLCRGYQLHR